MAATGNPKARRTALALGVILAALLVLAGVHQAKTLLAYLREVDHAASYAETTAELRHVEVKVVSNGDGTSKRLSVAYAYRVGNVEHHGHQVELVDHPALAPGWPETYGERLQAALDNRQPVPCFYDPHRPEQAVLDRRLRYAVVAGRLAATAFLLLAGFGLLAGLALWSRRSRDRNARQAAHPNEPWMWRADWAAGSMTTSNRTTLVVLSVLALAWNLALTPLAVAIHRESGAPGRWGAVGGTLAVLGGLMAWAALNQLRVWFKNGRIELRLATVPGLVGGPLGGVVHLPARIVPVEGFEARLSCFQDQPGDDSSAKVVWQDQAVIREMLSAHDPQRIGVPIYFAIPFDCLPTTSGGSDATVSWKLDLRRGSGLPFAQFEVPVFRTAESARDYRPDRELLDQQTAAAQGHEALAAVGIEAQPTTAGWRFASRMKCDAKTLSGLLTAWAVCAALVIAVFAFHWHWAIAILPGLFALVITYALVELLLWGSQLELDGAHCAIESGYRPWRAPRSFDWDHVQGVATDHEYSANEQQYYLLVLRAGGEKVTLAKRIASRRLADAAAASLNARIDEVRPRPALPQPSEEVSDALSGD